MKILDLVEELLKVHAREGNLEVTCTASTLPDSQKPLSDAFESTVENLHVTNSNNFGKHVRILWQC